MKVGKWSTTANNNNATPPDGWPEGQAPSTVNDCAREMMAAIRTALNDLAFIDLDHTPTQTSSVSFTLPGNVVSFYDFGRRVKAFDGANTLYGTVISSSFTTNTGITLRLDSGALTTSLTSVAVSVLSNSANAMPDRVWRADNQILNGQLDFWQRGTSFALGTSASTKLADRFICVNNTSAALNITRQERSSNASLVPTIAQTGLLLNNCINISVSAADAVLGASDYAYLAYNLEGYEWRQIAHKPNFCSFWVQSNQTGTYCVAFRNAGSDRTYVGEYNISGASVWEKKTFALPEAPTAGTWDYSNGVGLAIRWCLAAGTGSRTTNAGQWTATAALATANQVNFLGGLQTIRFADFRFYEGIQETPIEIRPYQTEFSRLERYYRVSDNSAGITGGQLIFSGNVTSGQTYYANVEFHPPMRTIPSVTLAPTNGGNFSITSASIVSQNPFGVVINNVATGTGPGFMSYNWFADADFSS